MRQLCCTRRGSGPGPQPVPGGSSSYEDQPSFSPDGRWLAYRSDESGEFEIYVRSYPGPGGKWQISTAGGAVPKWSKNGKELLYRTEDNQIMVVTYTASGDSFHADKPKLWSPGQFSDRLGAVNFDLSPDGKRVVTASSDATARIFPRLSCPTEQVSRHLQR